MKRILYAIFILCYSSIIAQVGIGTTTPDNSAVLDITSTEKGLLIPRMGTIQITNILAPKKGLIVFNNETNNFEFNSGNATSTKWSEIRSNNNSPSLKFDSAVDLNNINTLTANNINIFKNLKWNDNSSVYKKLSEKELIINNPGRYEVICNVYIKGIENTNNNSDERTGVEIFLAKDGIQVGVNAATGYIRFVNKHNTASLHINETIEINSASTISIQSIRKARNGAVNIEMSNIVINKVR